MSPSLPRLVRWLLGVFFRRIEVDGLENVPREGGGLLVAWHPNGLIDPGLILATFPRRVVFGARHGLFRWPGLGWLMRQLGTVPLFRSADIGPGDDPEAFRAANRRGLEALARAVAEGSFSALFPEGLSHDEPHPMPLRSGAARLYYQAVEATPEGSARPSIVPVGLHYDRKHLFRSLALVVFHPPLALPEGLAEPAADESERREQVRTLTGLLDRALHDAVHSTESWELHYLMHRARKLLRAERAHRAGADPGPAPLRERVLGFARLWRGYEVRRETHPEESRELLEDIKRYDEDLRAVGLDDHHLDSPPRLASPWLGALLLVQALLVFLVLPPVLLIGYLVNLPTAVFLGALARRAARKEKDEASIKVLAGAVAFPLTWIVLGGLLALGNAVLQALYPEIPGHPLLTALVAVAVSALGGLVVLVWHPLARELRRALRVRLTLRRSHSTVERLRRERSRLHDALVALSTGIDLPGRVAPDGRIVPELPEELSAR